MYFSDEKSIISGNLILFKQLLIFDELLYISFVNSFSNLSVRVALGIDFIIANLMIFNCSSVISPSSFKQLSTSLIFLQNTYR